jgi:hypothetical protein
MANKKQDNEDTRDVFEKALDKPEYVLTPEATAAGILASILGGMAGGRAIGRRLASKATRKAEAEALARADKDGSLGWGRGKDRQTIAALDKRRTYGMAIGGVSGTGAGIYAGTRRKERD